MIHCCSCGKQFDKTWRTAGVQCFKGPGSRYFPRGRAHYACPPCRVGGFNIMRHIVDQMQGSAVCNKGMATKGAAA